jgi:hypothetical protein
VLVVLMGEVLEWRQIGWLGARRVDTCGCLASLSAGTFTLEVGQPPSLPSQLATATRRNAEKSIFIGTINQYMSGVCTGR